MQISVAIPAFNEGEYLRQAIESILRQSLPPAEIIVVDDGSTDHTRAVCESFGSKVRYFYQENDGTMGGTARARAIKEAHNDWIAFLDQDDLWLPEKLKEQVEALRAHPDLGAVFTRYQPIGPEGKPLAGVTLEPANKGVRYLRSADAFHLLLRRNPFCPSSILVNRQVFDRCGYPDINDPGCGDWDLWLRIARHFAIALVDEFLTRYRVHPNQACVNKHALALGLKLTLARQEPHLHPHCKDCRAGYRAGRDHVTGVFAVAARTHLDQYYATARAGKISDALPYLRGAWQAAPREILRPRRFLAVLKHLALGTSHQLTGTGPPAQAR